MTEKRFYPLTESEKIPRVWRDLKFWGDGETSAAKTFADFHRQTIPLIETLSNSSFSMFACHALRTL